MAKGQELNYQHIGGSMGMGTHEGEPDTSPSAGLQPLPFFSDSALTPLHNMNNLPDCAAGLQPLTAPFNRTPNLGPSNRYDTSTTLSPLRAPPAGACLSGSQRMRSRNGRQRSSLRVSFYMCGLRALRQKRPCYS